MNLDDILVKEIAVRRGNGDGVYADIALDQIRENSPDTLKQLFDREAENLKTWRRAESFSVHGQALALYRLQKLWDRLDGKDGEFKDKWEWSFVDWAKELTGKDWKTLNNYITMARVWLSGEEVVANLPGGFNPWTIDPSKLILAAHKARVGEMEKDDFKKLADPEISWAGVRDMVNDLDDGDDKPKTNKPKPYFFVEDRLLWFSESAKAVVVAQLGDSDGLGQEDAAVVEHGLRVLKDKLNVTNEK